MLSGIKGGVSACAKTVFYFLTLNALPFKYSFKTYKVLNEKGATAAKMSDGIYAVGNKGRRVATSARRPLQISACKQVKMYVPNGLSTVFATVVYNSVAVFRKAKVAGNLCRCLENLCNQCRILVADFVCGLYMCFGDYNYMLRCLRLDVPKRQNKLILINLC
jgi:hypothetical protein